MSKNLNSAHDEENNISKLSEIAPMSAKGQGE